MSTNVSAETLPDSLGTPRWQKAPTHARLSLSRAAVRRRRGLDGSATHQGMNLIERSQVEGSTGSATWRCLVVLVFGDDELAAGVRCAVDLYVDFVDAGVVGASAVLGDR